MYGPNDALHTDKGCASVIVVLLIAAASLYAVL